MLLHKVAKVEPGRNVLSEEATTCLSLGKK